MISQPRVSTGRPHILVALSAHGYGHLAQCAPVLERLHETVPGLVVSICTALPCDVVSSRLPFTFNYHFVELDPVLEMQSAWEVDVLGSRRVYRAFHDDWDAGIQRDQDLLLAIAPQVVLADIPYRLLQAATALPVKTLAMCSLNWADIYSAYSENNARDTEISAQITAAYRLADCFLLPQPAMSMRQLDNTHPVGPIARVGKSQQADLKKRCGMSASTRVVLVALGGIETELPLDNWPQSDDIVWVFATSTSNPRNDMVNLDELPLSFIDVLASSDLVLTKPGYGTYTEAVCNGVAVLSLVRDDWPETVFLNRWAAEAGRFAVISAEQFRCGEFLPAVTSLLQGRPPRPVQPSGIDDVVNVLMGMLPRA